MSEAHDEAPAPAGSVSDPPSHAYDYVIVPFDGTPEAQRAAFAGSEAAGVMAAELVVATIGEGAGRVDDVLKRRAVSLSDERATMWVEPGHSSVRALETMLHYRPRSLICMYTHARTGLLHAVYGSLADQLLHELDAPLLLLGPQCRDPQVGRVRHLVVCVDHTEASATAVDLAAGWAEATGANATVVYRYGRDEIVANVDELILPLVASCPIVEKLAIAEDAYLDGVLGIVQGSSTAMVATAWSPTAGFGHQRHDPFLSQLSLRSPVPILVRHPPRDGRR